MTAALGPGVTAALVRSAALLRDDDDALEHLAGQVVLQVSLQRLASSNTHLPDRTVGLEAQVPREAEGGNTRESLPGHAEQVLDVELLAQHPGAIRRRVLRRVALGAGAPGGLLTSTHLAGMDALLTRWHGQGPVYLPGRLVAFRRCGTLVVGPAAVGSRVIGPPDGVGTA